MTTGVVMLVNEFPPLPVGGAEMQAERLSAYLSHAGWPVWVVTRRVGLLPDFETYHGYFIVRSRAFGPGKLKTVTFFLDTMWKLWKMRKNYQILHAHLAFGPAFAGVLGAYFFGKRVIVKLGNSGEFGDIRTSQSSLRGRLRIAFLSRFADVVIVLDETMFQEAILAGFSPKRIRRMNNGVDAKTYVFDQSRSIAKLNFDMSGKVVILYVGRLSRQKGLAMLLEAFSRALVVCRNLHLVLVGDGPDRSSLEDQSHQLGIQEHILFVGNKSDIHPYLNMADIFVLPSLGEGISNALLEAMSSGIACVATSVGGSAEVLNHGECGILLPPGDVSVWGSTLVELGNDLKKCKKLGEAARRQILRKYDFSVVGAGFEELYKELLVMPIQKGNIYDRKK